MGCRSESPRVKIPPQVFDRQLQFFNPSRQLIKIFLSLRSSDDLPDAREENIHGSDSQIIVIHFHIKGLYGLRIVGKYDRTFEVLLHQVPFMLCLQVTPPPDRVLPLPVSCLEYLNGFGICQPHKTVRKNKLQALNKIFVNHVVKELQVFPAVVKSIFYEILEEILSQIHVVIEIPECHLRFYHPELCQVTGRVRVFCTECRAKCIYLSQGESTQFTL